jgi:UDP-N-acetylglucosamine:LPS N-acetylglucosamine transferase
VRVHDLVDLRFRLQHFLDDPKDLARMKANARAVGQPDAAYRVAKSVLARL